MKSRDLTQLSHSAQGVAMAEAAKTLSNPSKMEFQEYSFGHLEPIPPGYCYTGVIMTMISFQILNKVVKSSGPPKCVPAEVWKSWKFRNLFISFIHAMIVGTWDILCFLRNPEMFEDLIVHFTYFNYAMVTFSTGYFFYDFIDYIISRQSSKNLEVLIHHVVVGGMFFYNLVICQCVSYNVIALMAEVNSIFLHARKLLQLSGVEYDNKLYRLNSYLNLITFVLFRFTSMGAILFGIMMWRERVTAIYYYSITGSMLVMTPINCILFWRLYKSDILRYKQKKQDSSLSNGKVYSNNNEKIKSS